jgi:hypothetical protein
MKKSFEPTFCCHSGREWQQIYIFTVAKNGAIRSWSCWRKLPLCQPSPNEIVADKGLSAPQFVALFVKTLNRVSIYCSPKLFRKKLTKIKSPPPSYSTYRLGSISPSGKKPLKFFHVSNARMDTIDVSERPMTMPTFLIQRFGWMETDGDMYVHRCVPMYVDVTTGIGLPDFI